MATPDDVTLGELVRSLAGLEHRINSQFADVQRRFDNLSFVGREVYEVEKRQDRQRIEDLEEKLRWMVRTLVASLLLPIIVAVAIALVVTR